MTQLVPKFLPAKTPQQAWIERMQTYCRQARAELFGQAWNRYRSGMTGDLPLSEDVLLQRFRKTYNEETDDIVTPPK